jgi:O-antigen ligase
MRRINLIFIIEIIIIGLVAIGILPRSVVPFWAVLLIIYFITVPLEEAVLFFARSIPLFIAIPITMSFDSLNMWRIFSIVIFLKWLNWDKYLSFFNFNRHRKVYLVLLVLLALSILSLINATDYVSTVKRIVFFVNACLIGIVIYDLAGMEIFRKKLVRNIAISTIVISIIGVIQLVTTYFFSIEQFIGFWGETVERNLFGNAWAEIALKANTWFAYFGDQLSLRMFSIFPDSHSFPIFLILGLPAILAISLDKIIALKNGLKAMFLTRGRIMVIFVPFVLLGVILSGTRGMWLAGFIAILLYFGLFWLFRRNGVDNTKIITFRYIGAYLSVFIILFTVAYPIMASPQFQMFKMGGGMLGNRVRSIINLGETSNSRRIQIWKDSLKSIIRHPLIGVGINNFPVVVNEDLEKVKAGSSAHNLYLHIAAEMGIPALVVALYFLWLLLKKIYLNFKNENDPILLIFFAASLLFIPWNLVYSLTDIAIFDERALLLFITTVALIFGNKKEA